MASFTTCRFGPSAESTTKSQKIIKSPASVPYVTGSDPQRAVATDEGTVEIVVEVDAATCELVNIDIDPVPIDGTDAEIVLLATVANCIDDVVTGGFWTSDVIKTISVSELLAINVLTDANVLKKLGVLGKPDVLNELDILRKSDVLGRSVVLGRSIVLDRYNVPRRSDVLSRLVVLDALDISSTSDVLNGSDVLDVLDWLARFTEVNVVGVLVSNGISSLVEASLLDKVSLEDTDQEGATGMDARMSLVNIADDGSGTELVKSGILDEEDKTSRLVGV